MDDENRERGTTLMKALGTDGRNCPMHVLWRVSALVSGEDIAYAEAHLERDAARQTTSGSVVVLTATRVIFAVIGRTGLHNEPNENASTVAVHCWGRRALTSIEMHESNENSDWSWHHEWSDVWSSGSPRAARLLRRRDIDSSPGPRRRQRGAHEPPAARAIRGPCAAVVPGFVGEPTGLLVQRVEVSRTQNSGTLAVPHSVPEARPDQEAAAWGASRP